MTLKTKKTNNDIFETLWQYTLMTCDTIRWWACKWLMEMSSEEWLYPFTSSCRDTSPVPTRRTPSAGSAFRWVSAWRSVTGTWSRTRSTSQSRDTRTRPQNALDYDKKEGNRKKKINIEYFVSPSVNLFFVHLKWRSHRIKYISLEEEYSLNHKTVQH